MKTVRKGTFETNSSSSHSIVFEKGCGDSSLFNHFDEDVCKKGSIVINPDEFGWELVDYTDIISKLSYLYTYIMNYSVDNKEKFNQRINDIVFQQSGVKVIYEKLQSDWYEDGYIDHESVSVAGSIFYGTDDDIRNFIFSKKVLLHIDNDNRDIDNHSIERRFVSNEEKEKIVGDMIKIREFIGEPVKNIQGKCNINWSTEELIERAIGKDIWGCDKNDVLTDAIINKAIHSLDVTPVAEKII